MARPRKPLGPVGYLKKEARIAAKQMMPHRVLWRVFGPGTQFPTKRTLKRKFGTRTVQMNEQTRRAQVQRSTGQAGAKTATKKTAAKRQDPYAAARLIPARNRAAAAKMTKATQPRKGARTAKSTGASVVPVRNPDGTFNGSKSLPTFGPAEQAANTRAWQGYVPPELLPRNAQSSRRG